MALFAKKEKIEKKRTQAVASSAESANRSYAHVLQNPRITEKATAHEMISTYVFDVAPSATKREIIFAIRELYKVTPRKIAIAAVPSKAVRSARTGKRGVKTGGKKAYVYLKKGEKITTA